MQQEERNAKAIDGWWYEGGRGTILGLTEVSQGGLRGTKEADATQDRYVSQPCRPCRAYARPAPIWSKTMAHEQSIFSPFAPTWAPGRFFTKYMPFQGNKTDFLQRVLLGQDADDSTSLPGSQIARCAKRMMRQNIFRSMEQLTTQATTSHERHKITVRWITTPSCVWGSGS